MSSNSPAEDPLPRIHNQAASPFFKLPLELRRAVYANVFDFSACHLHSSAASNGTPRLQLKSCIAPTTFDERALDGSERCPVKRTPDHHKWPIPSQTFKRRVLSSWGSHWMCEELALHHLDCGEDVRQSVLLSRDFIPALRVCKRMLLDLIGEATTMADFHVADLGTLKTLLETSEPSSAEFKLENFFRSNISNLSIILSQPLGFFEAIEKAPSAHQTDQNSVIPTDLEGDTDVAFWRHLPSMLSTQLPRLRKLHIWLDHNTREYWSVVNERGILGPIEALAASRPTIELVWVLPKVHPSFEDRQRHYLPEDEEQQRQPSSRLEVRRVFRQRYRVFVCDETGDECMCYVKDFPQVYPGSGLFCNMTQEEQERYEAAGLRGGINVVQLESASPRFRYRRLTRWLARARDIELGEFPPSRPMRRRGQPRY
ncbi:hypothetical protein B0T14DRAFT_2891 [Immersiella caudata]|uniref:DUF7730 domain-containing protein n=1 Tax=Immersiella caudata TaxID=314043 RepID=A0AA39XCJ0_9PEZI|nr:hypothetical protein B0T14DRAFT_2891 [Immersiella caudata]